MFLDAKSSHVRSSPVVRIRIRSIVWVRRGTEDAVLAWNGLFIIFFNIKLLHSQSPVKEELFNRVADHEVVIESGPVEYEKNDETNPVVEEDDFDELGEEDEEPISAAHLMGHLYNTGVEEEYVEYEDYE